jgi:S1-C subfamily serine protease
MIRLYISVAMVASTLTLGCAPRVHRNDEPLILEDNANFSSAPAIGSVEIPRIRTGMIARAKLDETLAAGVGVFLGDVDVAPHLQGGRFAGWLVERFDNPWVDLLPGDIVNSVNGARIETPAQVQSLWLKLKGSEEILVSVIRGEAAFELRFTVQGAASPEGS